MTVVKDETGNGHAVLTIRTAQGDFIADNKTNEILGWHETPYQYVMRQSYLNEQNWMRVGPEIGSFTRRKLGSNR
jgi:predicted transglutaminase-like cysteine proteinase